MSMPKEANTLATATDMLNIPESGPKRIGVVLQRLGCDVSAVADERAGHETWVTTLR
jgi:hypothetical protein